VPRGHGKETPELQRADTAGKGAPARDLLPEIRLAGERASILRATFRDRRSLMPSANSRRYDRLLQR
jgi:hypothetical protein